VFHPGPAILKGPDVGHERALQAMVWSSAAYSDLIGTSVLGSLGMWNTAVVQLNALDALPSQRFFGSF